MTTGFRPELGRPDYLVRLGVGVGGCWCVGCIGVLDSVGVLDCWAVGLLGCWGVGWGHVFDSFLVPFWEQRKKETTEFDHRFSYGVGSYGFFGTVGCWCWGLLDCWRLDTLRDGKL